MFEAWRLGGLQVLEAWKDLEGLGGLGGLRWLEGLDIEHSMEQKFRSRTLDRKDGSADYRFLMVLAIILAIVSASVANFCQHFAINFVKSVASVQGVRR